RKMFSSNKSSGKCAKMLTPWLRMLSSLWSSIGAALDDSLQLTDLDDEHDHADVCRVAINWGYIVTTDCLRHAVLNVACWAPSTAQRGFQPQAHVDWKRLNETSNGFFLRSVKAVMTDHQQA